MCEEESDDSEAVAKLLEINDSIHRTVERFKLIKKGDVDAASKIPKGTLGTSTGVSKTADNELSLIDFSGDSEPGQSANTSAESNKVPKTESLEDDLLGLSFQDKNYGQGGGIALGFGANSSRWFSKTNATVVADAGLQPYQDHRCSPQRRSTARRNPQLQVGHHNPSRLAWPQSPIMTPLHL